MADAYIKGIEEIQARSFSSIKELITIWTKLFNDKMCQHYLERLKMQVNEYFNDLINETLERKQKINDEINKLTKEAENLKDILDVEKNMPEFDESIPLIDNHVKLDEFVAELKIMLIERKKEVSQLKAKQFQICEELNLNPAVLVNEQLPTKLDMQKLQQNIEELQRERQMRLQTVEDMRGETLKLIEMLEQTVREEDVSLLYGQDNIKIDKETMQSLHKIHANYKTLYEKMCANIEAKRAKLENVWNRLNVTTETRQKYSMQTTYNLRFYMSLSIELKRCENILLDNLPTYISSVKQELSEWCNKTFRAEDTTLSISQDLTEEVLLLHENELKSVKEFYEMNRDIFECFKEHQSLWDRLNVLEKNACDPNRFNNRGGQLLKEEKERKAISFKMPKLEDKLKKLVQSYEQRECKPFLVYGKNILDILTDNAERKQKTVGNSNFGAKLNTLAHFKPIANSSTMLSESTLPSPIGASSINSTYTTPPTYVNVQKRRLPLMDKSKSDLQKLPVKLIRSNSNISSVAAANGKLNAAPPTGNGRPNARK